MMEYGQIEVHRKFTKDGDLESMSYEWKGPKTALVSLRSLMYLDLDSNELKRGEFNIGPYPVKLIGRDGWYGDYILIRTDNYTWWWTYLKEKAYPHLYMLKSRIIMTCWVWGLADTKSGVVPEWSDIKFIKRLKGMFDEQRKD